MGWPNNYAEYAYDSNGNVIGLANGNSIEHLSDASSVLSRTFETITKQTGQIEVSSFNETVPSALTGTAYYIDNLHGSASDGGAGTSKAAPWQNVSNLNLKTFTTGDTIYIANDNVFNYEQTFDSYKAAPLFTYEGAGAWKSTDPSRPITIKPYYPRGYSTTKPTIRWYASVDALNWTNVGGNVWRLPWSANFEAIVAVGATDTLTPMDLNANGNPALLDANGEWTVTGTYLYMYCTSNPTTFYGSVKVSDKGVFNTGFGGMHFVRVSGLRFELCTASNIEVGSNSSAVVNTSLEIDNCDFIKSKAVTVSNQSVVSSASLGGATINGTIAGTTLTVNSTSAGNVKIGQMLQGTGIVKVSDKYPTIVSGSGASWVISNAQTVANVTIECIVPTEIKLSVHDNYYEDCPGLAVKLNPNDNGHPLNSISWEVYRNKMMRGNLCSSNGALVYNQCVGGTKHIAWGNYGHRLEMYRKTSSDGCFLYAELSSKNSIFYANIIEQSKIAMQFNNAENAISVSNLAIDCVKMQMFTMAPDGNTPLASYIVTNNTYLWTGRYALEDLPGGNLTHASAVWSEWNDQYPTNSLSNFVFANNLAIFVGGITNKPVLDYISSQITNKLIAGNAAIGFGDNNIVKDNGVDVSSTSEYLNFIGSSSDISTLFPNASNGSLAINMAESHPLYGKGVPLSINYNDITGRKFDPLAPTIGCLAIPKSSGNSEWVNDVISQKIRDNCEVEIYTTGSEKLHQGTTTELTLDSFTLPKYSLGKNGYLRIDLDAIANNNANVKTINIKIGGTTVCAYALASQDGIKASFKIRNKNSYTAQTRTNTLVASYGYSNSTSNAFDTKTDLTVTVTAVLATATDSITRLGISAFTKYAV